VNVKYKSGTSVNLSNSGFQASYLVEAARQRGVLLGTDGSLPPYIKKT